MEKIKEEKIEEGPLNLLKEAVKKKNHICVYCRNNRKIYGQLRAFDRHMNMVLENIVEIWTEVSSNKKGSKPNIRNMERNISKMFLRGDSVILVVKKPSADLIKDLVK